MVGSVALNDMHGVWPGATVVNPHGQQGKILGHRPGERPAPPSCHNLSFAVNEHIGSGDAELGLNP